MNEKPACNAPQSSSRREFFLKGLAVAGAASLGGLASGCEKKGKPTVALTPDGKLIQVDGEQSACCAPPPASSEVRKGIPGKKWVMVIDLSKCDGCKSCTAACGKMHYIPPEREWIKVLKMQEGPESQPYWFPKPCFQCDNPPCTKVCPVDATFKRQDGVVLIDNDRCIGCRFCMAACPYSVRFFNWGRPSDPPEARTQPYSPETGYPRRVGTVEKCDFCPNMLAQGKLPACASGCPMGVIYMGDENEDAVTNSKGETLRLSQALKDNAGYRFMEELGTKPRVWYLPPKNRVYPAPGEEQKEHHHHG